eukprot:gene1076-782_t
MNAEELPPSLNVPDGLNLGSVHGASPVTRDDAPHHFNYAAVPHSDVETSLPRLAAMLNVNRSQANNTYARIRDVQNRKFSKFSEKHGTAAADRKRPSSANRAVVKRHHHHQAYQNEIDDLSPRAVPINIANRDKHAKAADPLLNSKGKRSPFNSPRSNEEDKLQALLTLTLKEYYDHHKQPPSLWTKDNDPDLPLIKQLFPINNPGMIRVVTSPTRQSPANVPGEENLQTGSALEQMAYEIVIQHEKTLLQSGYDVPISVVAPERTDETGSSSSPTRFVPILKDLLPSSLHQEMQRQLQHYKEITGQTLTTPASFQKPVVPLLEVAADIAYYRGGGGGGAGRTSMDRGREGDEEEEEEGLEGISILRPDGQMKKSLKLKWKRFVGHSHAAPQHPWLMPRRRDHATAMDDDAPTRPLSPQDLPQQQGFRPIPAAGGGGANPMTVLDPVQQQQLAAAAAAAAVAVAQHLATMQIPCSSQQIAAIQGAILQGEDMTQALDRILFQPPPSTVAAPGHPLPPSSVSPVMVFPGVEHDGLPPLGTTPASPTALGGDRQVLALQQQSVTGSGDAIGGGGGGGGGGGPPAHMPSRRPSSSTSRRLSKPLVSPISAAVGGASGMGSSGFTSPFTNMKQSGGTK